MLAKAIAKESAPVFINVRISNLMSKWFGDAQKLALPKTQQPSKLQWFSISVSVFVSL
ncbi:hypothetical protein FH972_027279 [Carpinus fangiana]|uniref:Uncharacterized protein n=1 Tax=Carpinus fangiana TaxID=176857 RepID=A0A5N6LC61_9ROSI|nr:hypothetical protein FH972_027279 [Carpinus fangiana]